MSSVRQHFCACSSRASVHHEGSTRSSSCPEACVHFCLDWATPAFWAWLQPSSLLGLRFLWGRSFVWGQQSKMKGKVTRGDAFKAFLSYEEDQAQACTEFPDVPPSSMGRCCANQRACSCFGGCPLTAHIEHIGLCFPSWYC